MNRVNTDSVYAVYVHVAFRVGIASMASECEIAAITRELARRIRAHGEELTGHLS